MIVFVRTHLGVALDMVQLVKHRYQGVRGQTVAELNAPLLPLPAAEGMFFAAFRPHIYFQSPFFGIKTVPIS